MFPHLEKQEDADPVPVADEEEEDLDSHARMYKDFINKLKGDPKLCMMTFSISMSL
jgi:hypothetical protein